ncbi:MAG: hypothetical protein JO066_07905, partial [Verrucomicrobia bacterium]|nr:hypothetical protein [Verrucomicrobiota bacterium]
ETVERGPQQVADELIARLPEFSNEEKAALAQKLQALGLFVSPSNSIELPLELLGKLGITPNETLDEERFIKLFTALLEMVITLDHLIWNVWRNVAPKSSVRREQGSDNPRRTIGRYLSGDREVASLQITQMLEKTRQLIAGLLSAIGPAGEIFARKHLERFAPEKIRASVESKSPGFISNIELRCWRRYVELSANLSGQAVETQIVDGIVSYTEELISRSEIRGR